jgi:thioredoxin 1
MSKLTQVNDDDFQAVVLNSETPVLVDFWAEWCAPCKAIAPILEEVIDSYSDRLKIVKINVDENQTIPAQYGVKGIPTLMIFKNGQLEATSVGALNKSQLMAFIDTHLN